MASRARQLSKLLSSDLLTVDVNNNRIGVNSTSPEETLDVRDSLTVGFDTSTTSRDLHVYSDLGTPVRIETTKTTSNIEFMDSETSSTFNVKVGSVGDDLALKSENATTFLTGSGTGTEKMRLTSDGDVGIGTTNPATKLDVVDGDITIRNGSQHNAIRTNAAGQLQFLRNAAANNQITVTIDDENGNVGIGSTIPLSKLSVTGVSEEDLVHISVGNTAGSSFANIRGDNEAGIRIRGGGSFDGGTIELAGGIRDSDPGIIKFSTGTSADVTEAMRIASNGKVGVNESSPNGRFSITTAANEHALRIDQDHATALIQFLETESTSYAGDGIKMHYYRGGTSAMNFMACDSDHSGGSPDRQFTFRGDGNAFADGTWNPNGADYAEYFESSTGAAIPVGTTVVLENDKVRAATSEDSASSIMGVIRPKAPGKISSVVGNSAWNKWSDKYLTDDFDQYILDEHVVYEWTETVEDGDDIFHSYESHQIPEGVTIPSDVVGQTHDAKGNRFTHYRLNPDFDPSVTYVPREERDEWVIVGLMGQVKILDGQPMNDRWVKMRDVSDSVEEWFIRQNQVDNYFV